MRGIDGERGEHREDLGEEVLRQPGALVVGQIAPAQDPDALHLQLGADLVEEDPSVRFGDGLAARRDAGQLFARGQPVGAADGEAGLVAALQPGHSHHVELVEVGREDREELGPLQQGLAGVLGQRQHAGVEVEPGQLAVEVAVVGQLGAGRGGARGAGSPGRRRRRQASRARRAPDGRRRAGRASRRRVGRLRPGRRVCCARRWCAWWPCRRGRRRARGGSTGAGRGHSRVGRPDASTPAVRARSPASGSRHHPRR